MKLIIAGSRNLQLTVEDIDKYIRKFNLEPTVVVSGLSGNVDLLGKRWAERHSIPVEGYPADWAMHDRAAGPIRNREMAINADALLLIWDGTSKGSRSMLNEARKHKLLIYQEIISEKDKKIEEPKAKSIKIREKELNKL